MDMYNVLVLILDGHKEIGANVRSNLCSLISLRRLSSSRAAHRFFLLGKQTFSFMHSKHFLRHVTILRSTF